MSKYATTTAISESPVKEGTLAVGTDDGLVQVTTERRRRAGRARRRSPGCRRSRSSTTSKLSLHDATPFTWRPTTTRSGDFTPYLYESTDLGRTWRSMAGDLPKGSIVWAIQQDHVRPDLLFVGTESGPLRQRQPRRHWVELGGGVPTVPFRDVKLHRRDNDLVGATFGRGVYVLDDYTPLRDFGGCDVARRRRALPGPRRLVVRALPARQAPGRPETGRDDFTTPNPPFGALFTYYLREAPTTARERRQTSERALREVQDTPFPGLERLRAEAMESGPKVLLRISDAAGQTVRWIQGPSEDGLHRVSWDLRGPAPDPVDLREAGFRAPWVSPPQGPLVAPGRYSAELFVVSAAASGDWAGHRASR